MESAGQAQRPNHQKLAGKTKLSETRIMRNGRVLAKVTKGPNQRYIRLTGSHCISQSANEPMPDIVLVWQAAKAMDIYRTNMNLTKDPRTIKLAVDCLREEDVKVPDGADLMVLCKGEFPYRKFPHDSHAAVLIDLSTEMVLRLDDAYEFEWTYMDLLES